MLDAHSQQTVRFDRERLAIPVQRLDLDMLRPSHGFIDAWHGQTALFVILHTVTLDDARIDEGHQAALVLGRIDDNHLPVHVHLSGGQADARRRIHRLGHVVDQAANFLVDFRYRLSDFVQPLIGIMQDT